MKRFFRTILILAVVIVALGFFLSSRGYNIPFFSKPENAVHELMKQENLMEILAHVEDSVKAQNKDDEDYSLLFTELLTSPGTKSYFLDNVRSMEYKITNVSTNGNRATVTAMITHLDISPVVDKFVELLADKLKEMASSGTDFPDDQDALTEQLWPVAQKLLREVAAKTKPTETYTTVKFKCVKDEIRIWELEDAPDEFAEALLMNIDMAIDNASAYFEKSLS